MNEGLKGVSEGLQGENEGLKGVKEGLQGENEELKGERLHQMTLMLFRCRDIDQCSHETACFMIGFNSDGVWEPR